MMTALKARPATRSSSGEAEFRVAAVLTLEPDRGVSFLNFAPRLMMHRRRSAGDGPGADRQPRQLPTPRRRRARSGPALRAWAGPRLGRGERIDSLENARPEVRAGIDRAQSFLGLTAMLAVILAASRSRSATRRYTERHLDGYAVMRCLGATQPQLFAPVRVGVRAARRWRPAPSGCVARLSRPARDRAVRSPALMSCALPQPRPCRRCRASSTGLVLLLGFALPPLLQLKNVPALRVIRRDVGAPQQGALAAYVLGRGRGRGAARLAGRRPEARADRARRLRRRRSLVFAVVGFGALRARRRARAARPALRWRYGLANLRRRAAHQHRADRRARLGLTAVLLLTFIRADLLDAWRRSLPPDAPDRFLVNIQPDQREPLAEFFGAQRDRRADDLPDGRAAGVAVNGNAGRRGRLHGRARRRQVEREFNLLFHDRAAAPTTTSSAAPGSRPATSRRARSRSRRGSPKRSAGARATGSTFVAAGRSFTAPITSVRKLDWDSMRPNFFVIATPKLLEGFPASYVTSFRAAAGAGASLSRACRSASRTSRWSTSGAILRQVQDDDGPAHRRGAVRVPVRARRRSAGAVRGAARDPGRAHCTRRR